MRHNAIASVFREELARRNISLGTWGNIIYNFASGYNGIDRDKELRKAINEIINIHVGQFHPDTGKVLEANKSGVMPCVYTTGTIVKKLGISLSRLRAWSLAGYIKPSYPGHGQGKKDYYTFSDLCKIVLIDELIAIGLKRSLAARILVNINEIDADTGNSTYTGKGIAITVPLPDIVTKTKQLLK